MPNNSVVVVIGGEDKSGAVLDQVEKHLVSLRARAAETDAALTHMGEGMVPRMAAASAFTRSLDGDFSHLMRAEERFLSTLPGMANLMQAAFPVIGIAAVGYGLYRAADGAYNLYEKWLDVGAAVRAYDDELTKASDKDWANFDSLETADERITQMTAHMQSLNQTIVALKPSTADWLKALTGDPGAIANLASEMTGRKAASDELWKNQAQLDEGTKKRIELEHKAALQKIQDDHAITASRLQGEEAIRNRESEQLAIAKENLDYKQKLRDATIEQDKGYSARNPGKHLDIPAADTGLSEYNETVRKITGTAGGELDKAGAEALKKQTEWIDRLRKSAAEQEKRGNREDEQQLSEMTRLNGEIDKSVAESQKKTSEVGEKALKEQIDAMREVQEERIKQAGDAMALAERTTEFEVRMGRMSASERVAALRDAANQEVAIKTDALQKIAGLDATSDSGSPEKVQKDLDEIKELQERHDQEMEQLAEQAAERRKAITDQFVNDILGPLMDRPKSIEDAFKKMGESIEKTLEKIAEHRIESLLSGVLDGDGGKGAAGGSGSAKGPSGGFGGIVGGLLAKLSGFGSEFGGAKASNGGLSTGAGTLPDSTASGLLQGRGTGAGGGVVVNLITQGTPQTVDSSGSQGNGQLEQMIVSIVLKDADTLGPMSQGIGGAIQMMGLG